MSSLTTGQASKILDVSKKTLMRWDDSGRFSPLRESISNIRVYDETAVRNLKILREHERRYGKNTKQLRKVMAELNPYSRLRMLSEAEMKLLDEEERLMKEHKELMKEFEELITKHRTLYRQFYIDRWTK